MAKAKTTTVVNHINTTKSMKNYLSESEYQKDLENAKKALGEQPIEEVMIPKQMADRLGSVQPVMINGVQMRIPVDGEPHPMPRPMAEILRNSLRVIQAEDIKSEIERRMGLKKLPE